jgi:hypothetical protein
MSSVPSLHTRIAGAFNDDELKALCFEHFRAVGDEFTAGMTKGQMIHLLLGYCVRRGLGSALLDVLEQERPGLVGVDREALLAQLDAARLSEAVPRQHTVVVSVIVSTIVAGLLFLISICLPLVIPLEPNSTAQATAAIPSSTSTPTLSPNGPAITAVLSTDISVVPRPIITISRPSDGEKVQWHIDIEGMYENLPKDAHIWVFVYPYESEAYFLDPVEMNTGTWIATSVTIGDEQEVRTEKFDIGVIVVDSQKDKELRKKPENRDRLPNLPGEEHDRITVSRY